MPLAAYLGFIIMAATLTQETGSGSSTANTYITLAEYEYYISDRGLTDDSSNDAKTGRIIQAKDWLETLDAKFKGSKASEEQALLWPRNSVTVYNFAVGADTIPQQLKDAQAQLVYDIKDTSLYNVNDGKTVIGEKVGAIELKYAQTVADVQPIFTKVEEMLSPIFKASGMPNSVIRA